MQLRPKRFSNRSGLRLGPLTAPGDTNPLLIVILVLAIVVGLTIIVVSVIGKSDTDDSFADGMHFWCEETGKEVLVSPKDIPEMEAERVFMYNDVNFRLVNPATGNRTLIRMWQCPSCKGYYVPEEWKNARGRPLPPYNPNVMRPICPHCKVDINKWISDHAVRK